MSLNGGVEVFRARRDAAFAEGKAVIDAVAAGQIEATRWGPELFSEDLW